MEVYLTKFAVNEKFNVESFDRNKKYIKYIKHYWYAELFNIHLINYIECICSDSDSISPIKIEFKGLQIMEEALPVCVFWTKLSGRRDITSLGQLYMYMHTYTYTYIHTHAYTKIHTHIYTYTYTHTHKHTYKRKHIHIHTYTHIYTHTYIHTYTLYRSSVFHSNTCMLML